MKLYYKIVLKLLNTLLFLFATLNKKRIVKTKNSCVKVNLGAGLKVYNGWINIDYNLPALFSGSPVQILNFIFDVLKQTNYSELNRPYRFSINKEQFALILRENIFVTHNLYHGIPFKDHSVQYFYSSHMIGFSFPKETSKFLINEIYRTLVAGGKLRLSLDGPKIENNPVDRPLNPNSFKLDEIKKTLEDAGFTTVKHFTFQKGTTPDLEVLDDYSPEIDQLIGVETIYLEAQK